MKVGRNGFDFLWKSKMPELLDAARRLLGALGLRVVEGSLGRKLYVCKNARQCFMILDAGSRMDHVFKPAEFTEADELVDSILGRNGRPGIVDFESYAPIEREKAKLGDIDLKAINELFDEEVSYIENEFIGMSLEGALLKAEMMGERRKRE